MTRLALLLVVLGFNSPAIADDAADRADRILLEAQRAISGLWQAAPEVGAGYSDLYVLKPDGTYEWHASQFTCKSGPQTARGRWMTDFESCGEATPLTRTIVLSELERETGDAAKSGEDCKRGKPAKTTHANPVVKRVKLCACKSHDGGTCRSFNGTDFWQISKDPRGYHP